MAVFGLAGGSAQQRPRRPIGPGEVRIAAAPFRPEAQFASGANEVQVEVRALDRDGHAVATLEASDFGIYDEGKLQTIKSFERVTAAGRGPVGQAVGVGAAEDARGCAPAAEAGVTELFFDDFDGSSNDLGFSRSKALGYLQKAACGGKVPGGGRIGIVTASGLADLDATEDLQAVRVGLAKVSPHPRLGAVISCPLISPYQAWDIVNGGATSGSGQLAMAQALKCNACQPDQCDTYVHARAEEVWGEAESESEAILARIQAVLEMLARQHGRRTVVLTSAGFLTQTQDLQRRQQAIINMAIQNRIVIDALDAKALQAPEASNGRWDDPWLGNPELDFWRLSNEAGGFSPVDSAMWEMAESTGGDFVHDTNDLQSGYAQDIQGPEAYYSLSFLPEALKYDGAFHHLKVKITRAGEWRVAARYGYFAPAVEDAPLTGEQQHALLREVLGSDRQGKLDGVIGAQAAPGGVHVTVRLNPNSMAFKLANGRHADRLTLVFALFAPDGRFAVGERANVDLRLSGASLSNISRRGEGLPVGATLEAAPGVYRLRAVALEPSTGALLAITGRLEIAPPEPREPDRNH